MTSELHALTGAYAVDALDDLERLRFARHLTECGDCAHEVRSLQAAAAELSLAVGSAPSTMLRERVLAEIRTVRPLAPVPVPVEVVRRKARRFPQLVAAAVVVLGLVIGGGYALKNNQDAAPAAVAVPQRVMDASDARTQSVSFSDGARATLYHSRSVDRSVLVTENLDRPPLGKVYELWYLQRNGVFVPAGLLADGGSQTVVLHGKLGSAKAVGITVEPAKGSAHPTPPTIAPLFTLSKSV